MQEKAEILAQVPEGEKAMVWSMWFEIESERMPPEQRKVYLEKSELFARLANRWTELENSG